MFARLAVTLTAGAFAFFGSAATASACHDTEVSPTVQVSDFADVSTCGGVIGVASTQSCD